MLDLTINGLDTLHIVFAPVREDGVAVRNVCLVSLRQQTIPGESFIRGIAQNVVSMLSKDFNERVRCLWDGKLANEMNQVEVQQKAVPDMRLLVKRIERKYQ